MYHVVQGRATCSSERPTASGRGRPEHIQEGNSSMLQHGPNNATISANVAASWLFSSLPVRPNRDLDAVGAPHLEVGVVPAYWTVHLGVQLFTGADHPHPSGQRCCNVPSKKTESNRSRSNPQGAKAESFMSPSSKSQEAGSEDTKIFHKNSSRKLLATNTRFFLEAALGSQN